MTISQFLLQPYSISPNTSTTPLHVSGGSRGLQKGVPRLAEVGKIAMYHVHATSHVLFLKFLGGSREPPEPPPGSATARSAINFSDINHLM